MKLLSYLLGTITHPIKTPQKLYSDKHKMGYAFGASLIGSILATLGALPISLSTASPPLWALPIIAVLFGVGIWVLPSLWIFIFCMMLCGKGKVEETMAVLALPLALFMVVLGLVTFPEDLLSTSGIISQSVYWSTIEPILFLAAAVWVLTISVFSVRIVHSLSYIRSVLAILLAVTTGTGLVYLAHQILNG